MTSIPAVITHNFDPARGAGRNLCDLPPVEAERVLDEIRASCARSIRANYLARRLAVEEWLIAERRRKLGATPLERPIYFFLGDFADGRDPSRPASLVLPLDAFRSEMLTFTYPDSMASLPIATRPDLAAHRRPYHGHVFTLDELREVVARFGMPGERWRHDPARQHDRFIEVQAWDAVPIAAALGGA
ncbi:hypothetical protein KHC28_21610 [Ancylobacter sonchi]|uniref:hypothetical protein n=1 Tax=Ancylobacter sonchi TaxID=1937790 RepID=UPI001BD51386|nr:hypothetical protein [Ancylobacter sonchi]MBS7536251.1 hypothetical protein [Ancylobacter sonchi]